MRCSLLIFLSLAVNAVLCQVDSLDAPRNSSLRFVFYNVENLFDTSDDPVKRDDDFTPDGKNRWTPKRYETKLQRISKTIIATGGFDSPDMIGLCEIENRTVLEDLTKSTALSNYDYGIIHQDSDDSRGIDVAFLYRRDRVSIIDYRYLKIEFQDSTERPTRDILMLHVLLPNSDTLHAFVNHWPSRFGGHLATDHKRMAAAKTVRAMVDSLISVNPAAKIAICGDFNDHPQDESIQKGLQALPDNGQEEGSLYNLMWSKRLDEGTHKFAGEWGVLDMFIVSHGLFKSDSSKTKVMSCRIFKEDFLLVEEGVQLGHKPFRTYQGPKYLGGFADHLPIILDLKLSYTP